MHQAVVNATALGEMPTELDVLLRALETGLITLGELQGLHSLSDVLTA